VNGGTIATAENTQIFLSGLITGSGPLNLSSPTVGSSAIFFFGSTANNYTGLTTVQTGFVELGGSGVAIPGDLLIQSASNVSLLASNQIAPTATVTDHGFLNFKGGAALTQTIGLSLETAKSIPPAHSAEHSMSERETFRG